MAASLMLSRCCRASKVMDTFPSSCLFQHSTLQPFHGTSFQGSPAIPTSNCTRITSEGSPPSLDFQPRNVTGKVLLKVTLLGRCPHGSPKLPGDLWEMEKNFWKSTDRVQSSLPGQGRSVPAFAPITPRAVAEVTPGWGGKIQENSLGMVSVASSRAGHSGDTRDVSRGTASSRTLSLPIPLGSSSHIFSLFSFLLFMLIPKLSNWEECK